MKSQTEGSRSVVDCIGESRKVDNKRDPAHLSRGSYTPSRQSVPGLPLNIQIISREGETEERKTLKGVKSRRDPGFEVRDYGVGSF